MNSSLDCTFRKLKCILNYNDLIQHSQLTFTCSKSTIETSKKVRRQCSSVVIVNFERISHLFLVFIFVDFEQVNVLTIIFSKWGGLMHDRLKGCL